MADSEFKMIKLDTPSEHVLLITLNRPEIANAFNTRMAEELLDVWTGLAAAPETRCVVLTGAGGVTAQVIDHNLGAFVSAAEGDCTPNAATGTGYQHNFVFQHSHRFVLASFVAASFGWSSLASPPCTAQEASR